MDGQSETDNILIRGWIDGQADILIHGWSQTDRHTDTWMVRQTDILICGWLNRQTY